MFMLWKIHKAGVATQSNIIFGVLQKFITLYYKILFAGVEILLNGNITV